jgi:hypothetical protein
MTTPPILSGCTVLPPLKPAPSTNGANGRPPARHEGHAAPAKGKPARPRGDRFATLNAFVDFTMQGLSRAESLVWLILFRDTKPDGIAQTSQADLARRAGVDVRTVKRAVTRLSRQGLLTVVFRGSLRRGPSAYRIHPLARERPAPVSSPPGR